MPNIAPKLCHDIVEQPELKRFTKPLRGKSTNKLNSSSTKRNVKPSRFVHINTQASSKTKISPTDVTVIKTNASILKSLAETAVSTVVTGPLRCDNNCVTLVRKRDNQRSCKCGHKRPNVKASTKSIQALLRKDFTLTDKACTHCVETATCGTQLLKNNSLPGNQKSSKSTITMKIPVRRLECSTELSPHIKTHCCHNLLHNTVTPSLRYVTAKRWALSHYPTRGPDF